MKELTQRTLVPSLFSARGDDPLIHGGILRSQTTCGLGDAMSGQLQAQLPKGSQKVGIPTAWRADGDLGIENVFAIIPMS